jgi:hypothetical protein
MRFLGRKQQKNNAGALWAPASKRNNRVRR